MEDKKLKKSLDFANKENIPYTIILGENEIKNNNFTSLTLFPFNFNCSYADIQLIGRIY